MPSAGGFGGGGGGLNRSALKAAAAFSVLLPACGNHDAPKGAGPAAKADDHGHDHGEHAHGPNGGELVELDGGAFHAEIGHDHEHGIIRVWVLGTDAKTPVAVEAPVVNLTKGAVQLTLTGAAPIKDGKATSWTAQHDALKADLSGAAPVLVSISAVTSDAEGDTVTLEWADTTADSYYAAGTHTIRVRAKDATGMYSEWLEKTFTVVNSVPTTPVITRSPSGNSVVPGTAVTITAASTDPDGDPVTLIWEGRNAETQTYPLGKNTVKVKAVDAAGAESPWAAIVFFVADSNSGGGMTLTGPESVILENGLEGATITNYTFTVPPVSGHSGSDYGRVRGYNVLTGVWDVLDYQTTTNGITFTRSLTAGVYSKLEFYYYTNHDCMYNKSNITYSVTYYFE